MFSQSGLSLDQAPPISVVFRFFLSGTLFGMLAGILVLIFGSDIFHPNTTEALILTHTLTLGVMLSFMFAALFQMLPVIAGVKLTSPVQKANWVQYPLALGILLLLGAFYSGKPILFEAASLLLGSTILGIASVMLVRLVALPNHSNSSRGMSIALFALLLLTLLALYLTGTLAGLWEGSYYVQIKTAHFSFGLFGWITLLIISISFQVIEMFYVTPPYPDFISKSLPQRLFGLLVLSLVFGFVSEKTWLFVDLLLVLFMLCYALMTLRRLSQRKRPIADATIWFWRLGMGLLVLSMAATLNTRFITLPTLDALNYIFFAGFALSIVFAMFYKIVPFLTWFHLNSQGYFTAPMMHEVIHPKTAMKHLYIHLAALVAFTLSVFFPAVIYLAGILTLLSFGWMLWQIVHAWRLYVHTQKTGEKFEMNIT
ncbi:hypothetical protein MNB_SV-4-584 [hydrothermal vent metagenome]|uniref:NnrS protein involved in response to NO n=1 Tax=hydrothermal vent metagenome TaxID=652676 RepID=A0A1W1EAT5_9ZZZZ